MSMSLNNNPTHLNKPLLEGNINSESQGREASVRRSDEQGENTQQLVSSAFAVTPNTIYGGSGMQMQMQPMQPMQHPATTFVPAGNMVYLPNQQPIYGYSSIPYTNNSVNSNQTMQMQMRVDMNSDAMAAGVYNPLSLGKQRAIYFLIILCCITCSVLFIVATVTPAIFSLSGTAPATPRHPTLDTIVMFGYYKACVTISFQVRGLTNSYTQCLSTSDQFSSETPDDVSNGIYGSQAAAIMSIVFAGVAGLTFALLPLPQVRSKRVVLIIFTTFLVLAIGSGITALALFIEKRSEDTGADPKLEYGSALTIIAIIGQFFMVFISIILWWKKVAFDYAVWPCAGSGQLPPHQLLR